MKRYNPSGIKIKVLEMPHEPDRFSPRGGPKTGDHVDILGRQSLNEAILRVAAGRGNEIESVVTSDIRKYAANVKVYEEGEDPEERDLLGEAEEKVEEAKEAFRGTE